MAAAGSQINASRSPDGRWLAYASAESGRFEVVLHAYPSLTSSGLQLAVNGFEKLTRLAPIGRESAAPWPALAVLSRKRLDCAWPRARPVE